MSNTRGAEADQGISSVARGSLVRQVREAVVAVSSPGFWVTIASLAIADFIVSWFAVHRGDVSAGRSGIFDAWDDTKLLIAAAGGLYLYRHTRAALAAVLALVPVAVMVNGLFSLHSRAALALQREIAFTWLRAIVPMSNLNWAKVTLLAIAAVGCGVLIWAIPTSSTWASHARILLTILFGLLIFVGPVLEIIDARTGFELDLGFTRLDMSLIEETVERGIGSVIVATFWVLGWRSAISGRGESRA